MLKTIYFILKIELILRFRRSQEWLYPLTFFLILILLFPLAFATDEVILKKFLPGFIWIAALLSSLLSIQTLFLLDIEEGYLEQLLFNIYPLPLLILLKLIAQWLAAVLPIILLTPLLGCLFHLNYLTIVTLTISLLLGTPIFILIGGLGTALTHGLRQAGVLLSVLILPLIIPVLIFGINIVNQYDLGFSILGPCAALAGLTILCICLLPFAISMALQLGLEN